MPPRARNKKQYGLGKATQEIELDLPSGNQCLVVRPGVQGLIKAGILDSLDTLTSIVQVDHLDANDPKSMARAVHKAAEAPEKLLEGMAIVDKTIVHVVKEPSVGFHTELKAGEVAPDVFVEDVDLDDKMFIFQFVVGGTRDLEAFRATREAVLGGLQDGAALPVSPE